VRPDGRGTASGAVALIEVDVRDWFGLDRVEGGGSGIAGSNPELLVGHFRWCSPGTHILARITLHIAFRNAAISIVFVCAISLPSGLYLCMRRSESPVTKYKLGDEPNGCDFDHLSASERVMLVWQLTLQSWPFKESLDRESRLRRDVVRLIRGKS
jgi:hypothetical protein